MKLEHGRYYATADGRRLGPASLEGERRGVDGRWSMSGHDYDDDGHATSGPSDVNDAVELWVSPEKPPSARANPHYNPHHPPQWGEVFDKAPERVADTVNMNYSPPTGQTFTKAPSVEELIGDDTSMPTASFGTLWSDPVSWQPTMSLRYAPKLQQLWVETFSGKTEWRDVPREAK